VNAASMVPHENEMVESKDVEKFCEKLPCDSIKCGEELSSDGDTHDGLLRLLGSGGEYPVDEQIADDSSDLMEFGLVDADDVSVEELYEDSKPVWKAGIYGELTLERNTSFLFGAHVNEMPVNANLQDILSQQLASGREYVYDENMNSVVEPDFVLSSAVSIQEVMNIQSFVRVPEQDLILEIWSHCFGHVNGTLVALEEMTVLQDLYKLTQVEVDHGGDSMQPPALYAVLTWLMVRIFALYVLKICEQYHGGQPIVLTCQYMVQTDHHYGGRQ
jgi:hypothetical protein